MDDLSKILLSWILTSLFHYFVKAKKVEKSSGSHFGFTWKYKENAILHNII